MLRPGGPAMTPSAAAGSLPSDIGVQVGLVVAAAEVPGPSPPGCPPAAPSTRAWSPACRPACTTCSPSAPRTPSRRLAAELARSARPPRGGATRDPATALALALDVAAVPVGLALRADPAVAPGRGHGARTGLRQAGWRRRTTGVAACSLEAARVGLRAARRAGGCRRAGGRAARRRPLGLTIAFVVDRRRGMPGADDEADPSTTPPLAAVGAGGRGGGGRARRGRLRGARAGLGGRPAARRGAARRTAPVAVRDARGDPRAGRRDRDERLGAGRCAASRPVRPPRSRCSVATRASRWTGPTLSGGPGSLVPWATLGKEGRRHMLTHVRPTPAQERPPASPTCPTSPSRR